MIGSVASRVEAPKNALWPVMPKMSRKFWSVQVFGHQIVPPTGFH